jgi:proline-rich protein PRCC
LDILRLYFNDSDSEIMMLGIEDYGSDNDSENEQLTVQSPLIPSPASTATATAPPSSKKSSISLPPPSNSKHSNSLSLPPPKTKRMKKITIGLPALPGDTNDDDRDEDERPVAKKPRLESGAGASSLLSMLPAPKQKAPTAVAPERVLGGGKGPGLVFNTSRPSTTPTPINVLDEDTDVLGMPSDDRTATDMESDGKYLKTSAVSFLPPSLKKGRSNISVEEGKAPPGTTPQISAAPAIDFFSLGSSLSKLFYIHSQYLNSFPGGAPSSRTTPKPAPAPSIPSIPSSSASLPTLSSAPVVEDFVPPEPTRADQYPGYYLLPSGSWAAYDEAYYKTFYNKWTKEYNAHVRALEKGSIRGFEAYDAAQGAGDTQEVDMNEEMERARKEIKEREDKKALTGGAAKEGQIAEPKMNIKGAKLGKVARGRHQLTTLLAEAYQNREALEDRIAEGRRNRKEAGNKYGLLYLLISLLRHTC